MGSFQGHALPGGIFLVMGLWWTIQITRRLLICRDRKLPFYGGATYPCGGCLCCCRCCGVRFLSLPLEGVVKMLGTTVGMVGELYASTDFGRAGGIIFMGDIQHVTMYSFFWISGLVDILVNRRVRCTPLGLDYLAGSLAFLVESILFSFHLHGRSELDVLIHTLLVYVVRATSLVVLLEYKFHKSAMLAYARAYLVIVQGTWFFQVGFILYNPFPGAQRWDQHGMDTLMLATSMFCWHMGGVFLAMILLGALTARCYTKHFPVPPGSPEAEVLTGYCQRVEAEYRGYGDERRGGRGQEGRGFYLRLAEEDEDLDEDEREGLLKGDSGDTGTIEFHDYVEETPFTEEVGFDSPKPSPDGAGAPSGEALGEINSVPSINSTVPKPDVQEDVKDVDQNHAEVGHVEMNHGNDAGGTKQEGTETVNGGVNISLLNPVGSVIMQDVQ